MIDLKVLQGKAPAITCPSRLSSLRVGPMTNVGVAMMLWSDASERLALSTATVALRSMQFCKAAVSSYSSAAMVTTPLQLRQFCWSNRAVYMSQ